MFKFGFDEPLSAGSPASTEPAARSTSPLPLVPAHLVSVPPCSIPDVFDVVQFAAGAVTLRKSAVGRAPPTLAPEGCDLVPGTYEGGYKLWEGAGDLIAYMHRVGGMEGKRVVELGAGHALPALCAAQMGAEVDVADFNEGVLREVTAVNAQLNGVEMRMVAGDWDGVPEVLEREYDFVLGSEVTYALESLKGLASCVLRLLRVGGVALIAGKSYYFGVGGGRLAFEKCVKDMAVERGVNVCVDVVDEVRDGKSNIREILRIELLPGVTP